VTDARDSGEKPEARRPPVYHRQVDALESGGFKPEALGRRLDYDRHHEDDGSDDDHGGTPFGVSRAPVAPM
jgi:hypothetical protein